MAVVGQGNYNSRLWRWRGRFGEVAEVGGVVAEAAGLEHAHLALLVGLVVSSARDAQDAGKIGGAVNVPATVAAGVLEDLLPAAAKPPECLSVVSGVKPGELLEQPVDLESMSGVHDERRLVRRCVEQGQRRVLGRWQGMPDLVGARAVVVKVQPQAGDADDVVGLAPCTVVVRSLPTETHTEVAVLVQVQVGHGLGDRKPYCLAAWGAEDGEPAFLGGAVEHVFESLWSCDAFRWSFQPGHGIILLLVGDCFDLLPPFLPELGAVVFFRRNRDVVSYPATSFSWRTPPLDNRQNALPIFRRQPRPSCNNSV